MNSSHAHISILTNKKKQRSHPSESVLHPPTHSLTYRAAQWYPFDQIEVNALQIITINGGSVCDSTLIRGVCFERPFVYAGYTMLPKRLEKPRILLLNCELELKHQSEHVKVIATSAHQYKEYVDTEFDIFLESLDKIVRTNCNIVLSTKCTYYNQC